MYFEGQSWRDGTLARNQAVTCGKGCHFTTYSRAVTFAEKRPHVIIEAKVHIDDILSVHRKMRVKAFSAVRIINLKM